MILRAKLRRLVSRVCRTTSQAIRQGLVVGVIISQFALQIIPTSTAQAQPPARPAATSSPVFRLEYIPRDAVLVFATSPANLLTREAIAPIQRALSQLSQSELPLGISPQEIQEFTFALLPNLNTEPGALMVVRATKPETIQSVVAFYGSRTEVVSLGEMSYTRTQRRVCFYLPDPKTVVIGFTEADLKRALAAGKKGASNAVWASQWSSLTNKDAVAILNTSLTRTLSQADQAIWKFLERVPDKPASTSGYQLTFRLSPLWQKSNYAIASVTVSNKVELRLISQSASEDEAKSVHEAMQMLVSFTRLRLSAAKQKIASAQGSSDLQLLQYIDLLDQSVELAQIVHRESQVGVAIIVDEEATAQLTKAAAPAISAAKAASYQQTSLNNLKQIGLAFHNYHDTYKTFPAAVQIGPKNIPHSWRVTILPFIGQSKLYQEYRQDEPWDSPNNLKVLEQIPDLFRSPSDKPDSTNASYFTFVGPGTLFANPRRASIADIYDGTANTLLAVESKRDVPWTKPDEIPFNPEQPLPEIGGWYPNYFLGVMCDGSVRRLPDSIDPQMLKFIIMPGDGQAVQIPGR